MSVYARKYRPKSLADLVGQQVTVRTLTNAFTNGNLHHAYLFVGLLGSGKTSTARILAAMDNCEKGPTLTPCNECSACKYVFSGTYEDVIEIDAASNAGKVEQIRFLKDQARYSPVSGAKVKYIIIDEAHRMSPAASEALLKLIEEPPEHVRFILCTTEAPKIRGTIASRCQCHEFRKIFWRQIAQHLANIAKAEGVTFENGKRGIALCAKLSNGSMRNAQQNLEALISFAGSKEITDSDAESFFGQAPENVYYDLIDAIIGEVPDASSAYKILHNLLAGGTSPTSIIESLIEHLDRLMVVLTAKEREGLLSFSEYGRKRLEVQMRQCHDYKQLDAIISSSAALEGLFKSITFGLDEEKVLRRWVAESIFEFQDCIKQSKLQNKSE